MFFLTPISYMKKHLFVVFAILLATNCFAQNPIEKERKSANINQDSIKKIEIKSDAFG